MGQCNLCQKKSRFISKALSVCLECIRQRPKESLPLIQDCHRISRAAFNLPETPPDDPEGIACNICINSCKIPEGKFGYCGLRKNLKGMITGVSSDEGKLSWYHDPLPTNCVGDWVCAGGTGAGYPQYACKPGPETGHKNLAVFFHACSFNCLFCQNWHFRHETMRPRNRTVSDLVSAVDQQTSCICYFGGDPGPQIAYSLKASQKAVESNNDRILRICWETNGSMHSTYLDKMLVLAIESGGCIKFDLKAWDDNLHRALTGISNRQTIENFIRAGKKINNRSEPPLLIASTLLVPGYIDEEEISNIAAFIKSINPDIPYSLLGFHPQFYMSDLPVTSGNLADNCKKAAMEAGLTNIRIGNMHLLSGIQ